MKLEEAIALLRGARYAEAEAGLKAIVAAGPARPEALEMLGVAVSAQGREGESLPWFGRALEARPAMASALHNRARALFGLGRLPEARADLEAALAAKPDMLPAWTLLAGVLAGQGDAAGAEGAYRRVLALRPEMAEAHFNLGVFLQAAGRADEAGALYRQALQLRPDFPPALNNLGNLLRGAGQFDAAFEHYARAIRVAPEFAEAHSNWGAALRESGQVDAAIPLLERAIALKPASPGALNNLGIAYFARNRVGEAVGCYQRALALKPDFHEALTNLGNAHAAMARWDEAARCYEEVIRQQPRRADAYNNLGLLHQDRGDLAAASASYERALALDPAHADAINNMGFLLDEQGRRGEAMGHYRRALALNPRLARAAYNLGIDHLYRGEFVPGWGLIEARFETMPPMTERRRLALPALTAADLGAGRNVAIWSEQGVGDQLVYATLLADLAARGERFVAEVDARLVAAFARAHPEWRVVAPGDAPAAFADCDRQLALGSLPALLRPDLASFAAQPRALLNADIGRAAGYGERVRRPGARTVGISWRSFQPKVRGKLAAGKSAPLAVFTALSQRADLRLLDLQYGDTAAERAAFADAGGRLERIDDLDLFNDLEGVLAAIEACDVVVTTSNVTAHFAGALGKHTLLVYLAGRAPFHYWQPGPDGCSLWYPAVEVVSSPALVTWEAALARVDELLRG